jgi:hypothetical protein
MLWYLLFAILSPAGQLTNKSTQSFRIIPIPKREHGYSNFASVAIMSQNDMNSFLRGTSKQMGWNNKQEFEDALRHAKLDFSEEALVLLRHTEGSGSVQVTFETPILQDRKLLCEIRGRPIPPGYGGTTDMAYYCFAVVVSKSEVSQVELQAVVGGFSERRLAPIVFPITEKGPRSRGIQSDRLNSEKRAAVKQRLEALLSGISVSKESVMRSMYPAPDQPLRELTIEWQTKEDVTSKASNEERLSTEGVMTIVKSQPSPDSVLRDRDDLNLVPEQLLIVGISSKQELTWWTIQGDPRFVRPPTPRPEDPPDVYQERWKQHMELRLLTKSSFWLLIPDDEQTAEIRFYHPGWTGAQPMLKLIGKVSL